MVEARDLHFAYGRLRRSVVALRGASMAAEAGAITALIGPNGAGKTTLLRVLLGLLAPHRGQCRVAGQAPAAYRRAHGVGYLPEHLALPRGWTVRDLLKRSVDLSVAPDARDSALEVAVERTGLDAAAISRRADRGSRGMQRRVGIAFALAGDPAFVLLDEPFLGLEPAARRDLRSRMEETKARGGTVLFASHELREVAEIADSVVIIKNGSTRPVSDRISGSALENALLENPR